MESRTLQYYIDRYTTGTISKEEWKALKALLKDEKQVEMLNTVMDKQLHEAAKDPFDCPDVTEEIVVALMRKIREEETAVPMVHRVHFLRTSWFRYAAAVVLLIGGFMVWYQLSQPLSSPPYLSSSLTEISPGIDKAVLTVGNKTIDLATNKTGIAVGNVITYNDGEKIADAGQQLTLTTPRGGRYQAVLPDGSKVWLNAASRIKFPSKFNGNTREIEVTGEVYLEIAKNTKQPFFVHTRGTKVQVLGTSFNVNAYEDEAATTTTLVEGSVKVKAADREAVLKPGEQAEITNGTELTTHSADIEQVLAWKNNMFQFKEATIHDVMRQLIRWYDVEVIYEGEIKETFFVRVNRDVGITQVLKILEATGAVHFEIEGKKIKVRD